MNESDKMVLNETYKNSKMGVSAIQNIMNKVDDNELSTDLSRQQAAYKNFMNRAEEQLRQNGEKPEKDSVVSQSMLWAGIQAKTIFDSTPGHIANMMIEGNTRGITDMMKVLHENKSAQSAYCEMANELMDFEQRAIEQLKYYI